MPDLSAADIQDLAIWRSQQFNRYRRKWDILSAIWHGKHRQMFPDEFPDSDLLFIAGFIRRSWKLFARMIGKVPTLFVDALDLGEGLEQAATVERVGYVYHRVWDMQRKMRSLGIFAAGFGAAGLVTLPDPRVKFPMLLIEDPRNVLPGPGWTAASATSSASLLGAGEDALADASGTLDDCIIRKTMTGAQIRQMFGGNPEVGKLIPDTAQAFKTPYTILMYYDDENVTSVLEGAGIRLGKVRHGASWCPCQFYANFAPDAPAGDSDFFQQIGLEVAFMRILNTKLALNDAVVWPWLALSGGWEVTPERRLLEASSTDARAELLSPPGQFQMDRDVELVRELMRIMNNETEATQGSMPGGPITGQGIDRLNEAPVVGTVQAFFEDFNFYLPRAYTTAMIQDREIFGPEKKAVSTWGKGETFLHEYTPMRDIPKRLPAISTEFGPGIGGFEGWVQMLQTLGAEAISLDSVMEKNPHIRSLATEKRRTIIQKIDTILWGSALEGQSAVHMEWLARTRTAIAGGADPAEWIQTNPPEQATATAETTPPLPPEVVAAGGGEAAPPNVVGPALEQLLGVA